MSGFLARIFLLSLMVGVSVLTMIYGWGVTPKSWVWIIGAGFFGKAALLLVNRFLDKEDKE